VGVPGGSVGDVAVVNVTNTEAAGDGWGALRSSDASAVFDRPAGEQYSSVNFAAQTPPNPNLAVTVLGEDGEFCYDNALSSSNVLLDLFAVIPAANVVPVDAERLLDTRTEFDPAQLPWNPTDGFPDPAGAAAAFMQWVSDSGSVGLSRFDVGAPELSSDGTAATAEVVFDQEVFDVILGRLVQPVTTVEMVRQRGAWFVSSAHSPSIVVERPLELSSNPIEIDFTNALISAGIELDLYADFSSTPFVSAKFRGGGIFAAGDFRTVIDPVQCVEPTDDFDLTTCTGPPPPGTGITLVITTTFAVETVR
jgi:hypothetical protein